MALGRPSRACTGHNQPLANSYKLATRVVRFSPNVSTVDVRCCGGRDIFGNLRTIGSAEFW